MSKVASEVWTTPEPRNDIKPEGFSSTRVLDLHFPRPCKVRGVDDRSVEIEIPVIVGQSVFGEPFCKQVLDAMGETEAECFLDDMSDYILRQFVIRNIR